MTIRLLWFLLINILLTSSWSNASEALTLFPLADPDSALPAQGTGARRVNAPYDVPGEEAAILWFGKVTPTENSVDARVSYKKTYLYVRVSAIDRRLWYDTTPTPGDLTAWDAVTLYLDLDGNTGNVPDTNAYRFDAQLVAWGDIELYKAAYSGDGGSWVAATVPFTTTAYWSGSAPNDEIDDRGWALKFQIPYKSLGLSGPPAQGTLWGMALSLHDRDDAAGTPIAVKVWPETMEPQQPATWAQLAFGAPTYNPPLAVPLDTVTIRHGLNGTTVVDGDVGGSSACGAAAGPDFFPTWGELNYAGNTFLNVQNLGYISEWPCFSRYYVAFPLDALPPGQVIISATLTLYHFGNAGQDANPGPLPSFIQVHTVDDDWDEATLTWNNAPLAQENVSSAWVEPFETPPGWPGVPRYWDVSLAVAQAYAAGHPLRLALYESDWAFHSGKYFVTSEAGEANQQARPTLTVTLGRVVANPRRQYLPLIVKDS